MSHCIGSGYCCMKAPCPISPSHLGPEETYKGCSELLWEDGRHWCRLVTQSSGGKVKLELSVGAGCCSSLNSWRREPLRDRR